MIKLTEHIPQVTQPRAEWIRLYSVYSCYPTDALFWVQDNGRAYICCLNGDMTVLNICADTDEIKEFINMIAPQSIFSDADTLAKLGLENIQKVNVISKKSTESEKFISDETNSRRVYELFKSGGLSVPDYEYFAVDFCRRLNHSYAECFLIENKCAAYTVTAGDYALLQGIASREKGGGTLALNGIMQKNTGRTLVACCDNNVLGFYKKKEFEKIYDAAYWVRSV